MRNEVFVYLEIYSVYLEIYDYGVFVQGVMMYVKVCTADVPCTDGYIHFKKCTDIIELCTYIDVSF